MSDENWNETLVEKKVKYILELEDRIIVVENVPARVSLETGERYFAPETVERLQQMSCYNHHPLTVL
jgi:YgiT-type zinc finger domain-containing protein